MPELFPIAPMSPEELDHLEALAHDEYASELGVPASDVLRLVGEVRRLRALVETKGECAMKPLESFLEYGDTGGSGKYDLATPFRIEWDGVGYSVATNGYAMVALRDDVERVATSGLPRPNVTCLLRDTPDDGKRLSVADVRYFAGPITGRQPCRECKGAGRAFDEDYPCWECDGDGIASIPVRHGEAGGKAFNCELIARAVACVPDDGECLAAVVTLREGAHSGNREWPSAALFLVGPDRAWIVVVMVMYWPVGWREEGVGAPVLFEADVVAATTSPRS